MTSNGLLIHLQAFRVARDFRFSSFKVSQVIITIEFWECCQDDNSGISPFLQTNTEPLYTNLKLKMTKIAQDLNSREGKTSNSGKGGFPGRGGFCRSCPSMSRTLHFVALSTPVVFGTVRPCWVVFLTFLQASVNLQDLKIITLFKHLGSLCLSLHTNLNASNHQP